ncbi:MAG: JmjC domain-containing protein [Egibacteraceae bacterium]
MDHRLIQAVEKALGWSGPGSLGTAFARGSMDDTELCERLLTPTKLLDLVMRRSLEPPQLRCFRDGIELHPDDYLAAAVNRRRQSVRLADMRRLTVLSKSGFTLVLDALDTFDPTMEVACRALQWWSHELVQVNAYLTTQDTAGFPLHWDDHDVLIIQLAGEKSWEVRSYSRPVPMSRDAEPNLTPSEEIIWSGTVQAGDMIHIPRGHWHQATRNDRGAGFSLHVTFGFVKRTGVDWLAWFVDRAREHKLFRYDLLRWGTASERATQEQELIASATMLLSSLPPSEFLRDRERVQPSARHVTSLNGPNESSRIVCITQFAPELEQDGQHVVLLAAGKRITLKVKALPALRLLLSGHPVQLGSVSAKTGVDIRQLAEVLIQEEICAELTPALSSGYTGLVMSASC